MFRLMSALALVLGLIASQANAGSVYFRGSVSPISPGLTANGGSDPLGLSTLSSSIFESLVTTNGTGSITGGYIVFLGKHYNFTTGTVNTVASNPTSFVGMSLVSPTNVATGQTFNISIPALGSDNNFSNLINVVGSFTISGGGIQYFGGIQAIPEPSSMMALTGLVVGAGVFGRRRRQTA